MTRSKPDPFTVACPLPRCAAAPGHLCRDQRTGEPAKHPHLDRIVAARGPSEKEELRRAGTFKVWDPMDTGEDGAVEIDGDDADDAAQFYMDNHAAGDDGYPDHLLVRGPDGATYAVSVTTDYDPVHSVDVAPLMGPIFEALK